MRLASASRAVRSHQQSRTTDTNGLCALCRAALPPAAIGPLALSPPHARFIHSEVMRDLVPKCIGDHLLQLFGAASHAFMRALVDGYFIGQGETFENRAAGERTALI